MDLKLVETFLAVAESQSYSLAAKKLGTPKSTISRRIATLERALGAQLLRRTTRHVTVTEAGRTLSERAGPLLSALRHTLAELPERESGVSGALHVTTSVDFGVAVLAPLVPELLSRYPNLTIRVNLSNAAVDLVEQGMDVAVRMASRRLGDSTLQARRVGQLALEVVGAPGYVERTGAPHAPKELETREWVRFRDQTHVRLIGPSGSVKLGTRGRSTFDDLLAVHAAVRAGLGVAILPAQLCSSDIASGRLLRLLPKWQAPSADIWCLWHASHPMPRKVKAFVEFLSTKLSPPA